MRRFAALSSLLVALVIAGPAAAAKVPPFPQMPSKWSHALINVTIARQAHTLILDRGRVTQSSTAQLTIREPDGNVATVPLSGRTIVNLNGSPATIYELARGMNVQTMRIDGGAAVRVRAIS